MPIEVERDVVGPDHDAVAWAVDQVGVERGVLCDGLAAGDVVGMSNAWEQHNHANQEDGEGGCS